MVDSIPVTHQFLRTMNPDTSARAPGMISGQDCDVESPAALPSLTPFFALIIGINEYTNMQNLRGAVADAKAMKGYLEEVLKVPEKHIHTLFDKEATRGAIIKAFRDLRDDQRIRDGDPILIYYSGHGGELPAPLAWEIPGEIQCLLPCDIEDTETAPNNGRPIPDYTVGTLIRDIAISKGNNITVIFDCCHSASGTRLEHSGYVSRAVALDHHAPDDLDVDIWGGRSGDIPPDLAFHGLGSHVLLAACGEKESAFEYKGRGLFTTALLSTLKYCTVSELSYTDLLKRIRTGTNRQNPRCEGANQNRILFNAKASAGRQVPLGHSVRALWGCKYVISAGLAHGVSHGVELTLYSDQKQRQHAVEVDDAAVIEYFQTTLTLPTHLPDETFAKLTRVGKLPFYLSAVGNPDLSLLFGAIMRGTSRDGAHAPNFQRVENVDEAKLEVVVDDQLATFNILDQRVNRFGLTTLSRAVTLDRVAHILNNAARYYWYLSLTNKSSRVGTKNNIVVDFHGLMNDYDDYGDLFCIPIEPGFCRKDSDGLVVIDFVVDPNTLYGIKITNNSPWDLYLNAFLFNNNNLSIQPYYTQRSGGKQEAPLKRNGAFTIGYGPGGTAGFAYLLEEGQDIDIGYLKIFFATQHVDLSGLVQMSPFTTGERDLVECIKRIKMAKLVLSKLTSKSVDAWFTVEIPVVQRRQ